MIITVLPPKCNQKMQGSGKIAQKVCPGGAREALQRLATPEGFLFSVLKSTKVE
jgi:hypothetical protein